MGLFDAGIGDKLDAMTEVMQEVVVQVTKLNHSLKDLNENMEVLTDNLEKVLVKVQRGK